MHAIANFSITHHDLLKAWHFNSNYIVCLSAKTESELFNIIERLKSVDSTYIGFTEPDMDNQLTSIAAYGDNVHKVLSNLPLALKEHGRQQLLSKDNNGPVAQLARAADSNPEGCGFEPHRDHI